MIVWSMMFCSRWVNLERIVSAGVGSASEPLFLPLGAIVDDGSLGFLVIIWQRRARLVWNLREKTSDGGDWGKTRDGGESCVKSQHQTSDQGMKCCQG
jgi:hypothetical protein